MDETLKYFLIVLVVLCVAYQMDNLIGRLARLVTIGSVLVIIFSDVVSGWQDKLLMIAIFGLPMYLSWILKYFLYRRGT